MVKPMKECKEPYKIENRNMSITHNIQNYFIILASHLNTSRATEILYTILELANIGLQHVIIEKTVSGPILLYLYVLYHHSSRRINDK